MIDTRFSTALQIVISVAVNEEMSRRCTSDTLAASLDTSASFVRKFLSSLSQSGLVKPSAGYQGGIRLGRPADEIRLSEIYLLVTADKRLWATRENIPDQCFITGNIGAFSNDLCERAERTVIELLGEMTIRGSIEELRRRDAKRCPVPADRDGEAGAAAPADAERG
jgi:Rrf2 family transcriptional regulator, repressor of oqxAB